MKRTGPNNPNWRGGRVIDPRGYVLIRVGKDHPLADVRGYAYEHRLKAEEKLGRQLAPGEQVHHDDENKGNNADGNLIVAGSRAEHAVFHRKRTDLRMPGADNPEIACACGCGGMFNRFDSEGRPRKFISGHNSRKGGRFA